MSDAPQVSPAQLLLRRFRSDTKKRLPLHPLERTVLAVVALHLCFLPWALGTMHAWSQITSLCFAVVGFVIALLPRTYSGEYLLPVAGVPLSGPGNQHPSTNNRPASFRLNPWPRLLKFPLFWIGLLLLAYIALQGYNPSWIWERSQTQWWLRRVNDIPWLPTSIDAPFERFNLWRQFIIYASAWLTLCTIWVGITRRRTVEILLLILLVNVLALAAFGAVQFVTGERYLHHLLGARNPNNGVSSFVYHNHAGAYFALLAPIALAFAARYLFGKADPARKSNPAPVLFVILALLSLMVVFTQSRGATITLACFGAGVLLFFVVPGLWRPRTGAGNRGITLSIALMFTIVLGAAVSWLNFDAVVAKFDRAIQQRGAEESIHYRTLAHKASVDFLREKGWRGAGAGAFRHYFPVYQKQYPAIYTTRNLRLSWEHAHCDWLEIPIELGLAGILLLAAGATWCLARCARHRVWLHPPTFILLLGCSQTLVHAWFDFPFQCPAILITWLAILITSVRWAELDSA